MYWNFAMGNAPIKQSLHSQNQSQKNLLSKIDVRIPYGQQGTVFPENIWDSLISVADTTAIYRLSSTCTYFFNKNYYFYGHEIPDGVWEIGVCIPEKKRPCHKAVVGVSANGYVEGNMSVWGGNSINHFATVICRLGQYVCFSNFLFFWTGGLLYLDEKLSSFSGYACNSTFRRVFTASMVGSVNTTIQYKTAKMKPYGNEEAKVVGLLQSMNDSTCEKAKLMEMPSLTYTNPGDIWSIHFSYETKSGKIEKSLSVSWKDSCTDTTARQVGLSGICVASKTPGMAFTTCSGDQEFIGISLVEISGFVETLNTYSDIAIVVRNNSFKGRFVAQLRSYQVNWWNPDYATKQIEGMVIMKQQTTPSRAVSPVL